MKAAYQIADLPTLIESTANRILVRILPKNAGTMF